MDFWQHYEGKCDNCGKAHPTSIIQVYQDRGDGVATPKSWCLECVQGKEPTKTQ
jgi:hypothetical protein